MKKFVVALLAMMLMVVGCKGIGTRIEPELEQTLRLYRGMIRWGDIARAYAYVKLEDGKKVTVQPGLENIRVTSYDVGVRLNQIDDTTWTQTVAIEYVLVDRQRVRRVIDHQVWKMIDKKKKRWRRTTPIPIFK